MDIDDSDDDGDDDDLYIIGAGCMSVCMWVTKVIILPFPPKVPINLSLIHI